MTKWLGLAGNGLKWLEMAGNSWNRQSAVLALVSYIYTNMPTS